ncbi:DUF1549 and DUF1553 domain-containing protein [Stieleria sp. ICT_E10.1]|uniref:DUF1549 and DUF1553 domain-containing protein n=1 Tax=Stieleria sedimenti TaxID=2976331 RepID=UPI0021805F89|nr:DUF1549 and DUF1553 domain-containing protein [Stieleria sedimenti]MCS7469612.1 DUF1549 and DUF1553 domain-containing protein [Stieleria sedimenti]
MTRSRVIVIFAIVIGSMAVHSQTLQAGDSLHVQVDALVSTHSDFQKPSAITDDASFLRRVSLDLAGTIPTAKEVREFLADSAPDKRTRLVDRLLGSPQYARRMQYVFDTMLMERRPNKHVTAEQWHAYLKDSFLQNKSWRQLSQELLSADGADEQSRAAARFLLDRELNVDQVTRDIGRIFLGRDLECAQCHDHPALDDYLQRHYYGLAAFIKRSYLVQDPKTKKSSIGEKAEGDVEFTSVFTSETDQTAPRMLDAPPIIDPPPGEQLYTVKPEKNVRAIPVYSRRLQLAKSITDDANRAFRENIANRMWALMMGRGLVDPVDMWHAQNPPTHPKLLNLLADSLLEHDYDLRYLLRELALTDTYQRSSRHDTPDHDLSSNRATTFSVALLKPLSPEQLAFSMMHATGVAEQQLAVAIAKQEKTNDPQLALDPIWQEEALNKALANDTKVFVNLFGFEGVQNTAFDASADQALFLRNGALVQRWVTQKNGLADRLNALDDNAVAEELYVSVFSRLPDADETMFIDEMLDATTDRKTDLQQLVWAALVSTEFRFNH